MKHRLTAHAWQEDDGDIAQCREVDVASQGKTEVETLANLGEALQFTPQVATFVPVPCEAL